MDKEIKPIAKVETDKSSVDNTQGKANNVFSGFNPEERRQIINSLNADPVFTAMRKRNGQSIETGMAYVMQAMNQFVTPYINKMDLSDVEEADIDTVKEFSGVSRKDFNNRWIDIADKNKYDQKSKPSIVKAINSNYKLGAEMFNTVDEYGVNSHKIASPIKLDMITRLTNGELAVMNNDTEILKKIDPYLAIGLNNMPKAYRNKAYINTLESNTDPLLAETVGKYEYRTAAKPWENTNK